MHTSILITALVVSRYVCAATIQNNHIERDVSAISVDIAEMFSAKINSTIPLASPTDGLLYVPDRYLMYSGNPDSWPTMDSWLSFEKMWSRNEPFIGQSCANNVESNTADETATILAGIHAIATSSGVDRRYILAVMLQESDGCVRVPTTVSQAPVPISNRGLFQSYNCTGTCNDNGKLKTPCPSTRIIQMMVDGVVSLDTDDSYGRTGNGLVQAFNHMNGTTKAARYYRAARW